MFKVITFIVVVTVLGLLIYGILGLGFHGSNLPWRAWNFLLNIR